jgi:putative hydrolase of the HAD superfamily
MGRATGDAAPAPAAAIPGDTAVRAVVFDYGGVLTTPVRDTIAAWLSADGIRPATFSTVLRAWMSRSAPTGTPVHRLEIGALTIPEFERLLAAELATHDGSPVVAEGLLSRLFRDMRLDHTMLDLVRELRARGLRTVLLSNSWGNGYPRELITELFHAVVISGEVGLRKPDPRIYRLALDHARVSPEQAVFVDDATPNTEAAEAVGMHAIHHTEPAITRARLAELVPGITTAEIG